MNRPLALFLLVTALVATSSAADNSVLQSRSHKKRSTAAAAPLPAADATLASDALFLRSSISDAKRYAAAALKRDAANPQALFVVMEAAALEGDHTAELDAALRLCAGDNASTDYAEVAAGRIRELAANTADFRRVAPRLRTLAASSLLGDQLRLALVDYASDGAPEFNLLQQSRESGLITDWRLAGPMGKHRNIDFDKKFQPELDGMKMNIYSGRKVEYLQFVNGKFQLPAYLPQQGVFYASSKVFLRSGGEWRLRVESPGTMQVFIDGRLAVTRDDRHSTQPEVIIETQHFEGLDHVVMVKFVASAAPFRIAIMAPTGGMRRKTKPMLHAGPESQYVSAALHYYRGDATASIRSLTRLAAVTDSASVQLALARAWAQLTEFGCHPDGSEEPDIGCRAVRPRYGPERSNALRSALRLSPAAAAPEEELAHRDFTSENFEDSLQHLKRSLSRNPESERALELLSRIAARFGWTTEANDAFDALLRIHPSCSNLFEAATHFAATNQFARATALEQQMRHCAPESLTYANWLASAGPHAESARAASDVVAQFPADRQARELEIRERLLDGDSDSARSLVASLAALAPNSGRYSQAVTDPALLLRSKNTPADDFATSSEFYRSFRRDGLRLVRDNESRKYSGGPAVALLNDKVAILNPDGSGAVYIHRITRVLNRDGIEQYGEVTIPRGAHLLELRTIKPDLTTAEPEFNQHKTTISMPALAPRDAIEQEYVLDFAIPNALSAHADDFQFTFGSFSAPVLFSKFVLIAAKDITATVSSNAPSHTTLALAEGVTARVWERNDIVQSVREPAMPHNTLFPTVRLAPPQDSPLLLRDLVLDALLEAARPGARTEQAAARLPTGNGEQTARALYRFVTTSIRPDDKLFTLGEMTSAEDSLASGEGSRTATLLALARSAGLSASLVLARSTDAPENAYEHPLVLFHFADRTFAADPEADNLPFGAIRPSLDRASALVVPWTSADAQQFASLKTLTMPVPERSLAQGDLTFDDSGTFSAQISITMGAFRGAEMRDILRGVSPTERPQFFEKLALRLFPGAIDVHGDVLNETDPDQQLILLVNCRSPHFLEFSSQTVDMDQLVPTLGLRRMYATTALRKFPLYIDSVLFENASFRVHLPADVSVARNAPDFTVDGEFGQYAVTFRSSSPSELEITREFNVPMQVIAPAQYKAFERFANQIDDAERQRVTLSSLPTRRIEASVR